MKIVLDAMGGDHAPGEIVAGALLALPHLRHQLVLVGDEERVRPLVGSSGIEIVHASEAIEMDEKPTEALRRKKDSSIAVGAQLVKDGEAQAFVSAGNTGAFTAACLLSWRQIHGFHRPAIGSPMPSTGGDFLLLDAGASPDVDPEHVVQFAHMGRSYAKAMWGRPCPRVHLLNIGEEPGKGNAFAKQTYNLLEPYPWFAGNMESKDIFRGGCDVVVCEAFVGNVVLKCAEGVAELVVEMIRREVPRNPLLRLAFLPLKKIMGPLRKRMDYAEVGGSPLLGLNGLAFKAHGRSNAKAVKNALLQAQTALDNNLLGIMRDSIGSELGK